jgi:hypothetical protein
MNYRLTGIFREFSIRSKLLAGIFAITFIVSVLVDLIALLSFFGLVGWRPLMLETAGTITAASIVPLLMMGMSISADTTQAK